MKKLLILSGKGGTGKTTTAAAFLHFAQARAAADCDVDAPNLHLVAQPTDAPVIADFLGGDKASIDPERCIGCGDCLAHCRFDAIVPGKTPGAPCSVSEYACEGCGVCAHVCAYNAVALHTDVAGQKQLYQGGRVFSTATLKMGRGNSGKLVAEVKSALMKSDLVKHAPDTELAIIDGSPGIGCPVIASVSGVDLVLMVAEPSLSGISDLKRLLQTARTFRVTLAVCVNKWDVSPAHTQDIQRFCEEQQLPFVGKIPYDKSASRAINAGLSLADVDCPARTALKEVYERTSQLLEQ